MSLIDELKVEARAGKGGDGVVRWLHLKGKEYSGPAGGNGGDGGDVYARAVPDINRLARYRGEKLFEAGNGGDGEGRSRHGRRGDDLYIEVPVGSLVRNAETGEEFELLRAGDTQLILKGGRGGAGNEVFKSSVNRSPEQSTPGTHGESATISIELRIIADAGLIGLPNAGKTSLLNAMTGAVGKVASYAFTTLDPNLGALYGLLVADIPGIIEGASGGKGLGFKFLRHIARTRVLLHCVSLESEQPFEDYETIRKELGKFEGGVLADKPEIIVLTKSDTRSPTEIKDIQGLFEKKSKKVIVVSVLDDESIKRLQDTLTQELSVL